MCKEEALNEKHLGNLAYQKRDFHTAKNHYEKAIELCPTEMTFHSNRAAVFFETKEFNKCVECCKKAVEVGRDNKSELKLVAKAMIRMGSAYRYYTIS